MAPPVQALDQLARRLAEQGRWDDDALRINQLILEQQPAHYIALRRVARWHEEHADLDAKREWLERALEAAPTPNDRRRVEEMLAPPPVVPEVAPRATRAKAASSKAAKAAATKKPPATPSRRASKATRPVRVVARGDTLLVPVERAAYELYERFSVHVAPMSGGSTADLSAASAQHVAFFVQGAIAPDVPRVLAVVQTVPTRTSTLPEITRAGGDSDVVAEAINAWRQLGWADDFARVILLSPHDDEATVHLPSGVPRAPGDPTPAGSEFVYLDDVRAASTYGALRDLTKGRANS